RASRAATLSVSRSPRSRIRIVAPDGASPAAKVAPPIPDPMTRTSTVSCCDKRISWIESDARGRLRVEQHRLVEVEGEGKVLAAPDIGVGAHARGQFLAGGVDDDKGVRAGRFDDLDG